MSRLNIVTILVAGMALLGAAPAQADFGLKELDVTFTDQSGSTASQAGSHPFAMTTTLGVNTTVVPGGAVDPETSEPVDGEIPDGEVKDLLIAQIPGFVGSQTAVPRCSSADFNTRVEGRPSCPDSTAIGIVAVKAEFDIFPLNTNVYVHVPVYNLAPSPGQAAKLGFVALNVPIVIDVGVSQDPPYDLLATLDDIPQAVLFYGSRLTIWGNPASAAHDDLRGDCVGEPLVSTKEPVSLGSCPVNVPEAPFLTLPRACSGPLATVFRAASWQDPDVFVEASATTHDESDPPGPLGMTGCSTLAFGPTLAAQPTSRSAESASGLEVSLDVKDEGLMSPSGRAHSDIRKVQVTLPEGMTANPSAANGLGVCTTAELEAASLGDLGCPEASKLGSVTVKSPLLEEGLEGALYLAKPYENQFGTLLALYMVIRSAPNGILVKQAMKVEADPSSGRLLTTVEEIPQLPFSSFELHFREGPRSPLLTPPACGTYTTRAVLTPWSGGEAVESTSSFEVTQGPGGGPCPAGPPFGPGFEAGTLNNNAGSHSPFYMRLTRRDGDQDLTRFSASLPPGMVARLAGTSLCPDAAIAAARLKSGHEELASPSCPASSQIGRVLAGAGVGEALTWVPGKVYLAGPYNGAPLSVVGVVPAVAGPFDVGTVVTRQALRLDPRTAKVAVDGEASDPIPHILAGIPLKVRDIRVYVERPEFTLNPTSCDPFAVGATLWGGGADVFSGADDSPLALSARFQAANCASLGFKPRLSLRLKGGTKRGAHPALTGTFRPRPGDANLQNLVLRLPRSAFLDQAHIRTICTRVQFAADACPKGAIYGHATAYTPLLEQPLKGPVYLRSSDHNLPDFVADLRGLVDVEAVARIDSKRGGIRATFAEVPDAPLTKVVVSMQGAKKGLIVNSTDLCANKHRADARLRGHNGKARRFRPPVEARCGKGRSGHSNRKKNRG